MYVLSEFIGKSKFFNTKYITGKMLLSIRNTLLKIKYEMMDVF